MNRAVLGFVTLGALALANVSVNGQTFQNGPYYAIPSWDQQIPTAQRFIVLMNWNNAAVLDRETGLVWQREPFARVGFSFRQSDAIFQCQNANIGGRGGWRLPAPEELMSLVDFGQSNPALPPGHPFQGVSNEDYSTATLTQTGTDRNDRVVIFNVVPGQTATGLVIDPRG